MHGLQWKNQIHHTHFSLLPHWLFISILLGVLANRTSESQLMNMNKQVESAYEYSWAVGGREAEKLLYNNLLVMHRQDFLNKNHLICSSYTRKIMQKSNTQQQLPSFVFQLRISNFTGNKSCYIPIIKQGYRGHWSHKVPPIESASFKIIF